MSFGTYNSDGSMNMSSGGKGGAGQAGQPNYQPTQATQGNPSVGIGFGMPPSQADGAPTDAYSPGITAGYGGEQAGPYSINGPAPMPTGPARNPIQGLPTVGMGGGKGSMDLGNVVGFGNMGEKITPGVNPFGGPQQQQPQGGQTMSGASQLGSTLGNVVGQFGNTVGQGLTQAGFGPIGNIVGQASGLGGQMINTGLNAAQQIGQPRVSNANLQNPRAVNRFAPPNAPGVRPKQVAGVVPALSNKLTVTRRR